MLPGTCAGEGESVAANHATLNAADTGSNGIQHILHILEAQPADSVIGGDIKGDSQDAVLAHGGHGLCTLEETELALAHLLASAYVCTVQGDAGRCISPVLDAHTDIGGNVIDTRSHTLYLSRQDCRLKAVGIGNPVFVDINVR